MSDSSVPQGLLQRKCACGKCAGCGEADKVPAVVHEVLRSPGAALDASSRSFFEPRFGHDFSHVRVHTGARAAESARAVGALAYTAGGHVVLGSPPSSEPARTHLLAHELAHTVQQGRTNLIPRSIGPEHSSAETEADRIAHEVLSGRSAAGQSMSSGSNEVQRYPKVGTRFTHPAGARSSFKKIEATFDGQDFDVKGDGKSILTTPGQSGRPVAVRATDAKACGGSTSESYLNNPRYVGITDYGAIPEGNYQFSATSLATFSGAEQLQMIGGGYFTDPFGATIHGGDWGAGRVPLTPTKILPAGCGAPARRSGFFLHGGSLTGSSGCIDIDNTGINALLPLLAGFKKAIPVRVRYTHVAPSVSAPGRAVGGFVYPGQKDPSLGDRFKGAWDQLFGSDSGN